MKCPFKINTEHLENGDTIQTFGECDEKQCMAYCSVLGGIGGLYYVCSRGETK